MSRYEECRKRKIKKEVRLSEAEWEAIKLRMKRCNVKSFSKYSRKMLIDGYFLVIDDSKELKEFTLAINNIGVNINQISHALNAGQIVSPETIDLLKDWLVTIWQYQRYILSGTPF